jgi:hypothetical protein
LHESTPANCADESAVTYPDDGRATGADEGSPALVRAGSPLARFLYDRAHFSVEKRRVKERAFLPPPSLRLSVFIIDALEHQEVVDLGCAVTERELRAYAKLSDPTTATAQGLSIERDDTPFRHAEIAGWPGEKERQKEIAQELASAATLHPL